MIAAVGASALAVGPMQSIGLVTLRLRFESHRGSFTSKIEQVSNLLCAQINLTLVNLVK